jgi:hypothetical protein
MTPLNELEVIQDGLTSPFWEWLSQHIRHEWGASGIQYQMAVRKAAESPNAVVELQKVLHTSDAMAALLMAPKDRLNQLKGAALKELKQKRSRGGV